MTENTQNNQAAAPENVAPAVSPTGSGQNEQETQRPLRGGRFGMRGSAGRRGGARPGRGGRQRGPVEKPEFDQKTLDLSRVVRVTKGGKRFSFRATVVAGNAKGRVGVGVAKGRDVQQAVQKAYYQAKRHLVTVPMKGKTIPYQVEGKYSSAQIVLKPSASGIKAGGAVRVVAQLAGLEALTGKLISRTNNKLNIARAAITALQKIRPNTDARDQKSEVKAENARM